MLYQETGIGTPNQSEKLDIVHQIRNNLREVVYCIYPDASTGLDLINYTLDAWMESYPQTSRYAEEAALGMIGGIQIGEDYLRTHPQLSGLVLRKDHDQREFIKLVVGNALMMTVETFIAKFISGNIQESDQTSEVNVSGGNPLVLSVNTAKILDRYGIRLTQVGEYDSTPFLTDDVSQSALIKKIGTTWQTSTPFNGSSDYQAALFLSLIPTGKAFASRTDKCTYVGIHRSDRNMTDIFINVLVSKLIHERKHLDQPLYLPGVISELDAIHTQVSYLEDILHNIDLRSLPFGVKQKWHELLGDFSLYQGVMTARASFLKQLHSSKLREKLTVDHNIGEMCIANDSKLDPFESQIKNVDK